MLKNYLTIAFRHLLKNKVFSLINVLGLALGMATCMLIIQYVYFENQYDNFHTQKKRIYRLASRDHVQDTRFTQTLPSLAPQLQAGIPEIEASTRTWKFSAILIIEADSIQQAFKENDLLYADQQFVGIFNFPLLYGDAAQAFAQENAVILTETLAGKYFDQVDASILNKSIQLNNMFGLQEYRITGVIEDVPENSHLQFNALFSFNVLDKTEYLRDWRAFPVYFLMDERADISEVEEKIAQVTQQEGYEGRVSFYLEPLEAIYLETAAKNELGPVGNKDMLLIFTFIAIMILFIAWINYINLATARATERAKEVGIRKVAGSARAQLIQLFLLEIFVVNLLSTILAITLYQLLLPLLGQLLNKDMTAYLLIFIPQFWVYFILLLIIGSMLSGIYPALVLSNYKPVAVLKGSFIKSGQGKILRKTLVVLQFAASIALAGGTYIVFLQIDYMRNENLGLHVEQTLVVEGPSIVQENNADKIRTFKNALRSHAFVKGITLSGNVPGRSYNYFTMAQRPDDDWDKAQSFAILDIDENYLKDFQIPLLTGENFSQNPRLSDGKVIINETAAHRLGYAVASEALGQMVNVGSAESPQEIIGITEDYHHKSLKNYYDPIIYQYAENPNYLSIKLMEVGSGNDYSNIIAEVQRTYGQIFPGNPFIYYFMDQQFDSLYQEDQRLGKIVGIFAALAIFIAYMGLFGLTAHSVTQRTKEIGIRKVLGASVSSILKLLNKDYVLLMMYAMLVSLPMVYWVMGEWLHNYAFTISYSVWMYSLPIVAVITVSILTVSVQTLKAAVANPAKSLRYE